MTAIFARAGAAAGGLARRCAARRSTAAASPPSRPARRRSAGDERHAIALPGMPNLHSHAFQRGMAGLAETRGPAADSFWTWREVMYRFALTMTPDEVEAIAAPALCRDAGGRLHPRRRVPLSAPRPRRPRPTPTSPRWPTRIAAAAGETGIGLTLLPVFYAHARLRRRAAERRPAALHQRSRRLRAACSRRCRAAVAALPGAVVGVAPHSLRAVTPEELPAVAALAPDGPIHIHIAEQVKEVEDCLAWSRRAAGRMAARPCRRSTRAGA